MLLNRRAVRLVLSLQLLELLFQLLARRSLLRDARARLAGSPFELLELLLGSVELPLDRLELSEEARLNLLGL